MQTLAEYPYHSPGAPRQPLHHPGLLSPLEICSSFLSHYPYHVYGSTCCCVHCCGQQAPFAVTKSPASILVPPVYGYTQTSATLVHPSRYHPYYTCGSQEVGKSVVHSNSAQNNSYWSETSYAQPMSYCTAGTPHVQPQDPPQEIHTAPTTTTAITLSHSYSPAVTPSSQSLAFSSSPPQYSGSEFSHPLSPQLTVVSENPTSSTPQLVSSDEESCGSVADDQPEATEVEVNGPAYRSQMGNRQPRKDRLNFSPEQIQQLEASFARKKYLGQGERRDVAEKVGISEAQVKTWYQNRRTKWKRSQKMTVTHTVALSSISPRY